ncbi:MAG: class I SAM-dependent methyltransferase [Actinomycetes bacterium]
MDSSGVASNSSDEWSRLWDAYQFSANRNPAQRFRRGLVADFAELIPNEAKFLDAGCGQGDTLALISALRPDLKLFGIELSDSGVKATQSLVPSASVQSCDLLADDLGLPQGFGEFDAAVCTEVLEHVDDPVQFLIALRSLLRPGARVFITVPGGPRSAFDRHIGHLRHFTAGSLTEVLHAAGFERSLVRRRGFPVFNLYKCVVMLRGESLIDDVDGSSASISSRAADVVMTIFNRLFGFVFADSRFGWQLTAEAIVE